MAPGAALTRFASLFSRGADLKYLFLSLIDVLRDTAVLSFTGQEALLFRHSPASLDRMRELTARRSREEWMLLLDIAFRSERDVLATEFPHLGFELLLLRLANAHGLLSVEALGSSADMSAEAVGAAKAEAVAQRTSTAAPAATFARKPPPVSATVPPVLPTAGVPQQREARIAPLPTPIGGTPPARSSGWGGAPEAAGKAADVPIQSARAVKPEADAATDAQAKGDSGLWDAVRRNLEGKKKTVLLGLLSQMRGELREGEFVITCGHEMMLDRLKEKDKWQPLLAALEEAAGRVVPVRLSVSTEKKSPEADAVAPGDTGLERKALEEPIVLEILRTFEGSMLVKVQPAPPVEVPRNEAAADADAGEPEIPEVE